MHAIYHLFPVITSGPNSNHSSRSPMSIIQPIQVSISSGSLLNGVELTNLLFPTRDSAVRWLLGPFCLLDLFVCLFFTFSYAPSILPPYFFGI